MNSWRVTYSETDYFIINKISTYQMKEAEEGRGKKGDRKGRRREEGIDNRGERKEE